MFNNTESNDLKRNKIFFSSKLALLLGVFLLFIGCFLYFQEYKKSQQDLKTERLKVEKIINKNLNSLEAKGYVDLRKMQNLIALDIRKYKKNSREFSKDITDLGSQMKIIFKRGNDLLKKEDQTGKYIEKIYYHYFFDERDVERIVRYRVQEFDRRFEKNYNNMLANIVNEVDSLGLKVLKEKDLERLLNDKFSEGIRRGSENL